MKLAVILVISKTKSLTDAATLVLAYSFKLEAQHYSGSYKSNYIGNECTISAKPSA